MCNSHRGTMAAVANISWCSDTFIVASQLNMKLREGNCKESLSYLRNLSQQTAQGLHLGPCLILYWMPKGLYVVCLHLGCVSRPSVWCISQHSSFTSEIQELLFVFQRCRCLLWSFMGRASWVMSWTSTLFGLTRSWLDGEVLWKCRSFRELKADISLCRPSRVLEISCW